MAVTGTVEADDERDLVRRLGLGDETAIAALYDRHASAVFAVALRVAGDRTLAEDVVQEVFSWVWSRADRFDAERGRLGAWLTTIAYRRAVDTVRREASRRRTATAWEPDDEPSAEDLAVESDVAGRVRAAVAGLPAAHRDVVRLLYFEGRTVSELARSLGVPEGTAKTRLRAARRLLADRLGNEGLVAIR